MGVPYEELLHRRVLAPLGMTDTGFHHPTQSRLAQPHNAAGQRARNWDLAGFTPGGGILSTTEDMVKFAKIALNVPKTETPPIKTATATAMGTVQSVTAAVQLAMQLQADSSPKRKIGLGWNYNPERKWYWHNGQTGGYFSMFLLDGEGGNAVVILSNSANSAPDSAAGNIITALRLQKNTPQITKAVTWLDLADQTDRQFFVDKEDGQYLGQR